MTVYIELVLFNNLAVDLLLILCTLTARRRKVAKMRMIVAAILGALAATAYAVAPNWGKITIRATLAPLMTLIFFKPQGERVAHRVADYALTLIVFVLFTFFVGGAVYGISHLTGADIAGYPALGLVAAALLALVVALRLILFGKGKRGVDVKQVLVAANGRQVEARGLVDSGNMLVDGLSGLPVVMLSRSIEERLGGCQKEGMIEVRTVTGTCSLPLVRLDGVRVDGNDYMAMGALVDKLDGYDVILQSGMRRGA